MNLENMTLVCNDCGSTFESDTIDTICPECHSTNFEVVATIVSEND